jgi:hypothetical protein
MPFSTIPEKNPGSCLTPWILTLPRRMETYGRKGSPGDRDIPENGYDI